LKALKHYRAGGEVPELIDLATSPPDKETLRALWRASGLDLRKFFNTSGQSYRNGDFGARIATMTDEEKLEALAADGMLIKRPIVVDGGVVRVGFREGAG
jgi:arsenate reductase